MIKLTNLLNETIINEQGRRRAAGYDSFTNADSTNDDPFKPDVPTLTGMGGMKRGEFDVLFAAANDGVGAVFRRNVRWLKQMIKVSADIETRKGLSTKPARWLGLIFGVGGVKSNLIYPDSAKTEPTSTPGEPSSTVINIDPLTVTDPFEFDKVLDAGKLQLIGNAQTLIDSFINNILSVKETYGADVYAEYIQFLKDSKPMVNGYASRDGNPAQKVQGKYVPCRGAGDGTRGAYDKCLSQKRAEAIRDYIESKVPDLAGVFQPIGKGQTVDFGGTSWPSPGATPSTSKPNRRFDVQLPTFNTARAIPAPQPVIQPAPPVSVTKQTTKRTWADWGITDKIGNDPIIWNIGTALNLPDATLQIPVAIDENSGRIILTAQVRRMLKDDHNVDLSKYLYSAPVVAVSPPTWDVRLTQNGVTVKQKGGSNTTTFTLNTWELTSGQSKASNLDLYVATQGTVFAVTNQTAKGWIVGEMSAAIINATRIVDNPRAGK
jgi:hypothetical protein